MDGFVAFRNFLVATQTLGPWGVVFFLVWWQNRESRRWEERFEAVKRMYENNAQLVKNYERLAKDQHATIILNTQALTKLTTILEERR